jgi:hypothetical protein
MTYVLGVVVNGHWRPEIGDPTIIGWLTTVLYLTSAGLCGIYAWHSNKIFINHIRNHLIFWWTLTVVMLLMAINKQLDLQSLLILVVKKAAVNQGWYSQRHTVKIYFVTSISICSFFLITCLIWTYRHVLRHYGLILCGITLLLTFIVIRAGSHNVKIFGWEPKKIRIHNILEIGGITCIGASALIGIFRCKRQATKTFHS